MTEWEPGARVAVLFMVLAVVVVRLPSLRRPTQRPALIVLLPLAIGALSIQFLDNDAAQDLDTWVGVPQFNSLLVSLIATVDFACVLWLAVILYSAGRRVPPLATYVPFMMAAFMATATMVLFAFTPAPARFVQSPHGWWAVYVAMWGCYCVAVSALTVLLLATSVRDVANRVLMASIAAITMGTSAEIPYQVIKLTMYSGIRSEFLANAAFALSFARFVLVALGCASAAIYPLWRATRLWVLRQRLHSLHTSLVSSTSELRLNRERSRVSEVMTFRDPWDELHRCTIEIQDCLSFLWSSWVRDGLDERARSHADFMPFRGGREVPAPYLAYWVAAAQLLAQSGLPRTTPSSVKAPITPTRVVRDDLGATHYIRLARALKSPTVQQFARTELDRLVAQRASSAGDDSE